MSQDLRYQLDGPMRKVRKELGLPPLETTPVTDHGLPSIILEYPGNLTGEMVEKIRRNFQLEHMGLANAHKAMIFPEDMTCSTGPR